MSDDETLTVEEERKQTYFSKIKWPTRIILVILVVSFIYSVSMTQKAPNLTYANITNPSTGIITQVQNYRYNLTSDVPIDSVSATYAFGQAILLAIVVIMLVTIDIKKEDIITIREAEEIIEKEVIRWQRKQMLPRGQWFIVPNFKLIDLQVGKGPRLPFKYVVDLLIKDEDRYGLDCWYQAEVNAKTRYFIGFIPKNKPLSRMDLCPKCGYAADLKVITSDEIKDFKFLKHEIGGMR